MTNARFVPLALLGCSGLALSFPQEEAKLVSSDAANGDYLGHAVGVSGETVIVGATGDDDYGIFTGSAYVFTRGGGSWSQQAKLLASDGALGQRFGWSAGVDGDTAVVGAIFGNGLAAVSGSAYVFVRAAGVWTEQQKLVSSDGTSSDWYSRSIGISGETIAVGAAQDDDNGGESGSVYIYDRSGTVWTESAKLVPTDGAANDTFGEALSLHGDLLVVGSPQDDDGGASASGSAYVFQRSAGTWSQVAKLTANDPTYGAWLGKTVHTDGQKVIAGAYHGDDLGTNDCGVAYVFSDDGGGWSQEVKLVASDKTGGDQFGWSVNIEGDEVLVGAVERASATGAVYRFVNGPGGWSEDAIVLASDASTGDHYGWALARDGEVAAVGATAAASPGGNSGAAYVLRYLSPYTPYCFGDPGSGTPCPCANDNDGSVPGSGCANGVFASGAQLSGSGVPSLSADTLVLHASGLEPSNSGLYFQANNDLSPGIVWGDGLQCAGGQLKRLGVRFSDAGGYSDTSGYPTSISVRAGNINAGDTKYYQCWYRNPNASPCSNDYNATNGLAVTWGP